MGIYDRDYSQDKYRGSYGSQARFAFPKLMPVVKWLLIINITVFVASFMIAGIRNLFLTSFSVYPASLGMSLQLWRLITYQFLHGPLLHILFNMVCLFFLGPTLEKNWGSKRFVIFYLSCGAAGGLRGDELLLRGRLNGHKVPTK